jgi:hypothetical protein
VGDVPECDNHTAVARLMVSRLTVSGYKDVLPVLQR